MIASNEQWTCLWMWSLSTLYNTPLLSRWRFTRSRCSGGTKTCTYFVVSYQKSSYEKWTNFTDNCIAATVYAALYTRCRITHWTRSVRSVGLVWAVTQKRKVDQIFGVYSVSIANVVGSALQNEDDKGQANPATCGNLIVNRQPNENVTSCKYLGIIQIKN